MNSSCWQKRNKELLFGMSTDILFTEYCLVLKYNTLPVIQILSRIVQSFNINDFA